MRNAQASPTAAGQGQRGFSMLEILISMFIMAVGLLGLVGMQALAQKAEFESYQRAQALILLNDIIDRVNTNRRAATCYAITTNTSGGYPYLGTTGANRFDTASFSCPALASTPDLATKAGNDLIEIDAMLNGAAEQLGGGQVGAMTGARACISYDSGTMAYAVAVAWQGGSGTFSPAGWSNAPAGVANCALNLYGSDTQRRVVWSLVRVASLQ